MTKQKKKSYPTLAFFMDLGIDISIPIQKGNHRQMQKYIDNLNEYELKYYHNKILKLPISMFDKNAVKDIIGNKATKETFEFIKDYELVSDEEYEEIKKEEMKDKIYKIILIFALIQMIILTVSTLSVYWRLQ